MPTRSRVVVQKEKIMLSSVAGMLAISFVNGRQSGCRRI